MKPRFLEVLKVGAMAGAVAAVINAVLFFIFHGAGFIPDSVMVQGNPMNVIPVVLSSFISSILASVVYFLLLKYTGNGFGIFRIVALVLLVLSFAQAPMMIPNVPLSMTISLNVMHVVVVTSLLYFFKRVQPDNTVVNYQAA